MPDDTLKRLLVRLNLDTKEFRQTVQQIKGNLKEINTQAKKDAEDAKSSEKEQIALIRQHINEQKSLTAEARAMTAVDAAKAQWQRKQQEVINTTIKQRALETVELKKQQLQESNLLKLEEQRLKLTQQHYRLQQQQVRDQERQQRQSQQGGGLGILGKITSTLAGGGLIGQIAGGALLGSGFIELLTAGADRIRDIAKAIVEATGPALTLRTEFEKLTLRAGQDPGKILIQLRQATRGLVSDMELYKISNNFLRQNLKITTDQMAELVKNTVNLARNMNIAAPQAAAALERAFLNPQRGMMMLARTTGISTEVMRRSLEGIPHTMDPTLRATIMFNTIMAEEEKMLKRVGVAATTLPELMIQVGNAERNFIDDIGRGVISGGRFNVSISDMSKRLEELKPKLEHIAMTIGMDIAKAIEFLVKHLDDIKFTVEALMALKIANWAYEGAKAFTEWAVAAKAAATATQELEASQSLSRSAGRLIGKGVAAAGAATGLGIIGMAATLTAILTQIGAIYLVVKTWKEQGSGKMPEGPRGLHEDTLATPGAAGSLYYDALLFGKKLPEQRMGSLGPNLGPSTGPYTLEQQKARALFYPPRQKEAPEPPDELTQQQQRKLEQQRLQLTEEMNKLLMDRIKQGINQREEAAKEEYELGIINLETYINKTKALKDEEYRDAIEQIHKNRDAQLKFAQEKTEVTIMGQTYPTVSPEEKSNAQKLILLKSQDEETELTTKHNAETYASDRQLQQDREAAYLTYTDAISKINKEGVQERLSVLETEFKLGNVGADSYIEQRKELIYEERDVTIQGLNDKLKAVQKNSKEEAAINVAKIEAEVNAEKQFTKLTLSEGDIRLKSLESHYENAKKYLQLAATTAKGSQAVDSTQRQYAINQNLLSMTSEYLNKLYEQQKRLQEGSTEWTSITEKIAQATEEQQKLNTELIQMRDTAAPLGNIFGSLAGLIGQFKGTGAQAVSQTFSSVQSSMEKLSQFSLAMGQSGGPGGLFSGLANSFTALFHPSKDTTAQVKKTAQDIFNENLTRSSSSMMELSKDTIVTAEQMRKLQDAIQVVIDTSVRGLPTSTRSFTSLTPHAEGGPVTPGQGYMVGEQGPEPFFPSTSGLILPSSMKQDTGVSDAPKIIEMFTSALKESTTHVDNFGSKLKDFAGKLSGIVSGISGMVQGVTSGKTGGEGALSGGMSGLQLGASVGGPIGAAVGLGVGGIMGGIFGAKEKSLMQDIHKIQDQMQSIVDSMNEGAITLSSAIQDLRNERQQAIQVLSQDPKGGKGGGKGGKKGFQPSQAQAVIDQIDAEIAQLVNQQAQLLSQLDQQVAILSNPLPFQQYVSSLDQIIQKYQQFASAAAGNAQAVGNAQLFLNESLQSYVTTLSQQLNQAQQQAIQDALTLLNLEYQRQQIINQEAQQEYDILTQGVLTRQRTTAMTKGQQIGQLQYQANMQLQQIDEQIALQQYKVQTEQQIFNLSTTRIGLEYQLLAAQEIAAGTQNEQTAALLQIVQQLQAGLASGSLMSSISALGPTGTGTGILTTLLGGLGLGGNVPTSILTGVGGATNYLSQIPQQYQSIANYINNLDPNFLTDLWSAMQTPAGSGQRMSVLQEAQPYANDANTSGYDFNSFAQWIQSGAAIQGSTATVNNTPAPTGPSNLPGGIPFNQPTTPGTSPSSIPGYQGTNQTPYDAVSQSMANLDTSTVSVTQAMQNLATVLQGINQGYGQASIAAGGGPVQMQAYSGLNTQIRRFQTGGLSTVTGPAIVDEGEYVLPKPIVTILNTIGGVQSLISSLTSQQGSSTGIVMPGTGGGGTVAGTSDVGSGQVDVQNTLLDITGQRTNMEMTVISARQDQITAEVQLLQAYSDMMNQMSQNNPPGGLAGNLESMFNQVYSTRGRYGSGSFRREYL